MEFDYSSCCYVSQYFLSTIPNWWPQQHLRIVFNGVMKFNIK